MKLPLGFEAASGTANIKPSGRPDLALLYSDQPLVWALTTTENLVKAPCVSRNRSRFVSGQPVRALVVNSGNANCAMGDAGVWDNEEMAGVAASSLALPRVQDALTASTGVIGRRLPVDKIRAVLPGLVQRLGNDSNGFAQAILTTDHRSKQAEASIPGGARVLGIAKGSGMIHPNMATMLAFVCTDADISQERLRAIWPGIVDRTFNQITVDGDTSTNDMAIALSSGRFSADEAHLARALEQVCSSLGQQIARDGEGATKLITVRVSAARTEREARAAARAVAGSSLVKSAMHGNDPNWGRILAAVGRSGALCDLANLEIRLQDTLVYRGAGMEFDAAAVSKALDATDVLVSVALGAGEAAGTAWGCDLSEDYVRINADYTT